MDRNFPVFTDKPKLLSLNTICYEREAMSVFQADWNFMTVPSEFVRQQLLPVVSSSQSIRKIPHSMDPAFGAYYPDCTSRVRRYFDYDENLRYILSPHRPDPTKGHEYALEILKGLQKHDRTYRLLIPSPPNAKQANLSHEALYIRRLLQYAEELGVRDQVILHEWIEYEDLPSYYSIGEFTLFLSRLPETFGLSLLNSAACGTPTISFGVGALPKEVPVGAAHIVVEKPGDAVDIILKGKDTRAIQNVMKQIKSIYQPDSITKEYQKILYDLYRYNDKKGGSHDSQ